MWSSKHNKEFGDNDSADCNVLYRAGCLTCLQREEASSDVQPRRQNTLSKRISE